MSTLFNRTMFGLAQHPRACVSVALHANLELLDLAHVEARSSIIGVHTAYDWAHVFPNIASVLRCRSSRVTFFRTVY